MKQRNTPCSLNLIEKFLSYLTVEGLIRKSYFSRKNIWGIKKGRNGMEHGNLLLGPKVFLSFTEERGEKGQSQQTQKLGVR